MSEEAGIPQPNYTGIPNVVIDNMHVMSNQCFRVITAICRMTYGWQKPNGDRITLGQLKKLTGMSTQGVLNGVEEAVLNGVVEKRAISDNPRDGHNYRLRIVNNVDYSTTWTTPQRRQALVNNVDLSADLLVNDVDTPNKYCMNEINTERKENSSFTSFKNSAPKNQPSEKPAEPKAKNEAKPKAPKPKYVWGSIVPLEDPLHQAVMRALQIRQSVEDSRKRIAEETAIALRDDGRTAEDVDKFVTNWWKFSFWGTRHKRKPKPEELRNDFDEILNLSEQSHEPQSTRRAPVATESNDARRLREIYERRQQRAASNNQSHYANTG